MAKMEERDTGMALFLVLSFNKFSEYVLRTGAWMQLVPVTDLTVLMAVMVVTEDMAVTQVKAVMVELEEQFESLFPMPTLIFFFSVVQPNILVEKGVLQGNWGKEVTLFRAILPRCLSEINFSTRFWRNGWGRGLVTHH